MNKLLDNLLSGLPTNNLLDELLGPTTTTNYTLDELENLLIRDKISLISLKDKDESSDITIGVIGNDKLLKYIIIRPRKNMIIEEVEEYEIPKKMIKNKQSGRELFVPPAPIQSGLYANIQSYRKPSKRKQCHSFQVSLTDSIKKEESIPKILSVKIKKHKENQKTSHRCYGKYNKLSIDKWRSNENIYGEDELEDLYYEDEEEDIDSTNLYQKDIIKMNQRKTKHRY